MTISQNTLDVLQDAPQPNMQPDEFNLKAFAFAAVLYTLGLEINETVATLNQASTTSESGDTLTIGLGAKNLTVEAGKSFAVGMSVRIADTVTGTRWMNGDVTAYDSTTGNMSVNVSAIQGSGNANVWTISQSFGGLSSGSVDTDKLAPGAVTTAKVADDAISLDKLSPEARQDASEEGKGRAELATQAETNAGTDDSRIITPLKLKTWANNLSRTDQTANRSLGATYTNTSGRTRLLQITINVGAGQGGNLTIAGIANNFGNNSPSATAIAISAWVLNGESYSISASGSSINRWVEIN